MNIDEPIHLEGFTENWSRMFTEEQQLLCMHLADFIDILIGVGHMDRVKPVIGKLQECQPEK
ncbi:hypothetical protein ACFYU8_13755 [Brevibacillus sp. NPDC003359]|uniref:hypothetical protein n=1 Tax=unclassified Brevibacillus TaxID=2684853 RepID=UPI0036A60A52